MNQHGGRKGIGSNYSLVVSEETEETAWNSEIDSHSDTSTPAYKRGRYETREYLDPGLDLEAIEQIKLDCKQLVSSSRRPPSVHILADAQVEMWPQHDNICIMDYRPGWSLKRWTPELRAKSIRIQCHSVILYMEKAQNMEVPPLKNALQTLCRVIRQHRRGARIYISNLLPRVYSTLLQRPITDINFVILQAVRSVNRALTKIHFLTVHEHFVSKRGNRIIKPTHLYFYRNRSPHKVWVSHLKRMLSQRSWTEALLVHIDGRYQ